MAVGVTGEQKEPELVKVDYLGTHCLHFYVCLNKHCDSTVYYLVVQKGQLKLGHQLKGAAAKTGLGYKNTFNLGLIQI